MKKNYPISNNSGTAEQGYMRLPELKGKVPFSTSTIWRKSRDGSFPAPVRLSSAVTAWSRKSVAQWLKDKEAQQ